MPGQCCRSDIVYLRVFIPYNATRLLQNPVATCSVRSRSGLEPAAAISDCPPEGSCWENTDVKEGQYPCRRGPYFFTIRVRKKRFASVPLYSPGFAGVQFTRSLLDSRIT